MIYLTKTPLRVSMFGGGTDYPEYFNDNVGSVIGGSIDKYIYIFAHKLPQIAEQKFRVSYRSVENVNSVNDIKHPVIREVIKMYDLKDSYSISTTSEIPGGTGLGSSSSFTVGFINLVSQIIKKKMSPLTLAKSAINLERNTLNENVGVQDHLHASFGGFKRYKFKNEKIIVKKINISKNRMSTINESMVLIYTNFNRSASNTLKKQIKRTNTKVNDKILNSMNDLTNEAFNVFNNDKLNNQAYLQEIGSLLNESWKLKKLLSPNISNSKIDELYQFGLNSGAIGAKLLGAGAGGYVLFLVPKSMKKSFYSKFDPNLLLDVNFVNSSSTFYKF